MRAALLPLPGKEVLMLYSMMSQSVRLQPWYVLVISSDSLGQQELLLQ